MGCRQTKSGKDEKSSNEVKLDVLGDNQGNGLPKVDSRLPLDTRQVFKIWF
jgi:hypothetical protein